MIDILKSLVGINTCDHYYKFKDQCWIKTTTWKLWRKTFALVDHTVCTKCNQEKYISLK